VQIVGNQVAGVVLFPERGVRLVFGGCLSGLASSRVMIPGRDAFVLPRKAAVFPRCCLSHDPMLLGSGCGQSWARECIPLSGSLTRELPWFSPRRLYVILNN
jgi:hypothetical protein